MSIYCAAIVRNVCSRMIGGIPSRQVDQDAAHRGQLRRADHGDGAAAFRSTIQRPTLCFLSRVRCSSIYRAAA
eukprot:COSAG02_NODE_28367_length_591_cov_0.573171_2_plen_72_part_01